jgi:hypothetical protein
MRSHFIAPPKIVTMFAHLNATTQIKLDGFSAWVIVDKN